MAEVRLPLPIWRFSFLAALQADDALAAADAFRGRIGAALKRQTCVWEAMDASPPCDGCPHRAGCHYGMSFKPPGPVEVAGFGKLGTLPHEWVCRADGAGLLWRGELLLAGRECRQAGGWRAAIGRGVSPLVREADGPLREGRDAMRWISLTPARLKHGGRNARKPELAAAVAAAAARRARLLAALNAVQPPSSRLPEPEIAAARWVDGSRHSRTAGGEQPLGGWMLELAWPPAPSEWRPWLALLLLLGLGGQTHLGLGRFAPAE